MDIKLNKIMKLSVFALFFIVFSYFKVSFGLGSYKFFFSGINFIAPLVGVFFSLPVSVFFLAIVFLIKKIAIGGILTFGLPTIISSLCFSDSLINNNKLLDFSLKVLLPLLAITLFCIHPTGNKAYLYSFYWFVPVAIYFVNKIAKYNSIYLTALTATFLAHAVGSVIWLYVLNLNEVVWNSLIPIVAVERLVFSAGISLIFILIKQINFSLSEKLFCFKCYLK
ncbi:MAG: hypothetical protein ABIF12_02005 [bacterium]